MFIASSAARITVVMAITLVPGVAYGQQCSCPPTVGNVALNTAAEGSNIIKTVERFGSKVQTITCAYGITGSDIALSAKWTVAGGSCDCVPSVPPAYAWMCSDSRNASVYISNPFYPDLKPYLVAAAKDLLGQAEHHALYCPGMEPEVDSTPVAPQVCNCPDDLALRYGYKLVKSGEVNRVEDHPFEDGRAQRILCTYVATSGEQAEIDVTAFWATQSPSSSLAMPNTCTDAGIDIVNSETRQVYARVAGYRSEYERTAMTDLARDIIRQVELWAVLCPEPGQTIFKIQMDGYVFTTEYEKQDGDDGRPIDIYFFPMPGYLEPQATQDGELLWGRFVRVPSFDYPDQSEATWYYVTWVFDGSRFVEQFSTGVTVEFVE